MLGNYAGVLGNYTGIVENCTGCAEKLHSVLRDCTECVVQSVLGNCTEYYGKLHSCARKLNRYSRKLYRVC
jgi:hypothetical protein